MNHTISVGLFKVYLFNNRLKNISEKKIFKFYLIENNKNREKSTHSNNFEINNI